MSFLQLFAAGKGLVGMKNNQSPYRMRPEKLLPKFESTKNPFAPPAKNEPVKIEPATLEISAPPPPAKPKVAPMETYPLFDSELKPAVAVKTIPLTPALPPLGGEGEKGDGRANALADARQRVPTGATSTPLKISAEAMQSVPSAKQITISKQPANTQPVPAKGATVTEQRMVFVPPAGAQSPGRDGLFRADLVRAAEATPVKIDPPILKDMQVVAEIAPSAISHVKPAQPEANVGLVDTRPLGLKSGTPTKPVLPAPVSAAPSKRPGGKKLVAPESSAPSKDANNCVSAEEGDRLKPGYQTAQDAAQTTKKSNFLVTVFSKLNPLALFRVSVEEGDSLKAGHQTTQEIGDPLKAAHPTAQAEAPMIAKKSNFLGAFLKKLNPLALFRDKKSERRRARPPVQTELSLDKVRVVCNDLSDTDLEVVIPIRRVESEKTKETEKTEVPVPRLQRLASASVEATGLNRLTSRIFGADQIEAQ